MWKIVAIVLFTLSLISTHARAFELQDQYKQIIYTLRSEKNPKIIHDELNKFISPLRSNFNQPDDLYGLIVDLRIALDFYNQSYPFKDIDCVQFKESFLMHLNPKSKEIGPPYDSFLEVALRSCIYK